ncbi:MAG TPA: hypothetical protein VM802_07865 [Chitinophaga sp.]|uniref:hypothetical protein n=1 Tax=Chitinophaga sp. TaxID=1869181 RepID=UPI002B78B581|nr:hypothetical protein [Chitinophaga sp.]HVI44770.1 hypothetical protein [Chitinophaga sp.]
MALNNDTVQQYIDRLKKESTEAGQHLDSAKAEESKKAGALDKTRRWSGVLGDVLGTVTETNRLGMIYLGTLERTRQKNEKIGENASLSVEAVKILICETRKVLDCSEVLKGLIKILSDRIDCKIPSNGPGSILNLLQALKAAMDVALAAIKDAVNLLLATYHLEEELWEQLAGENGTLKQVTDMHTLVTDARKPGVGDCASCHPKKVPVFPMDDEACDFYTKTKHQYEEALEDLKRLQKELEKATCKREFAQARKEALDSALAAALAAKACETKK